MKTTLLMIVLMAPPIWAQRVPKRPANGAPSTTLHLGSLKAQRVNPSPKAAAPAAGVAVCHLDANGALSAAFVNTASIPSGATITGSITLLDDNSSINFTGESLTQTLPAGSYIALPIINSFGELWSSNGSAFEITVQIQPGRGTATQVACDALLGEVFGNADLSGNAPLLGSVTQSVASNKDLKLILSGYFTGDTPLVVLVDFYNVYLAPASAVSVVSPNEIDLDLSQIAGLDLSSTDTLFVSVAQAGFSDTVEYRYLPPAPGSFNPAPQ